MTPAARPAAVDTHALWRIARAIGVLLTGALLAGLWIRPEPTLRILWNGAIPLLPAVFLAHPGVWRNVCPLATLNTLPGHRSLGRRLPPRLAPAATIGGIVLLGLLVPARHFLFNTDGPALALVILGVAAAALGLGLAFNRKAGFCNAFCPVLPVERLYGQAPLLDVPNAHCANCSLCTPRGCIDLAPARSIAQTLGQSRQSAAWLRSPYGIFAAAFPGFVIAYFLVPDLPLAEAGGVYLRVGAGAAASYALTAALVRLSGIGADAAIAGLGASALLAYYWFAGAAIADAWTFPPAAPAVRIAALALMGVWLRTRSTGRPGRRPPRRAVVQP